MKQNIKSLSSEIFPCKILLFGEYTILDKGAALGIPYYKYTARWEIIHKYPFKSLLFDLLQWCKSKNISLDYESAYQDLENNWGIHSNIPFGYGLGSSGAITVAIYKRYSVSSSPNPLDLKNTLSVIESYFQGSSSGIDPLIIHSDKPLYFTDSTISTVTIDDSFLDMISLYDSGIKRNGKEVIRKFKSMASSNPDFSIDLQYLASLNSQAINSILSNERSSFETVLREISTIQRSLFASIIPEKVKNYWDSISDTNRIMKFCGAGGGGFFLEFTI